MGFLMWATVVSGVGLLGIGARIGWRVLSRTATPAIESAGVFVAGMGAEGVMVRGVTKDINGSTTPPNLRPDVPEWQMWVPGFAFNARLQVRNEVCP